MKIIKVSNYEEMSKKAAEVIAEQIKAKSNSVLGLATGSTPIGLYKELISKNKNNEIDFSNITTVNLDEYIGLPVDNDQSYYYFMFDNLFNHVNIKKENVNLPSGIAEDMDAECDRYEELIKSLGGIDIQLLGIGHDGHIGFNEPDSYFPSKTHVVDLNDITIEANSRFFEDKSQVPVKAVSMGVGTIMHAKKVLLIASGKDKAEIMKKALFGPVVPEVPASVLQFHQDVTVITDCDI